MDHCATTRLAAVRARKASDPNPFVLGKELTQDYFTAMDHCMQALIIQARNRGK